MAKTAIFIRGFDFGTTSEDIEAHCSPVGEVVAIELKGKAGALVTFDSEATAQQAAEDLDKSTIGGNTRYIDVTLKAAPGSKEAAPIPQKVPRAIGKPSSAPVKQVITKKGPGAPTAAPGAAVIKLHGFDFGTSEQDVRKHCSRSGKVVSVELKGDKGGSALVTYSSMAAAEKAVHQLQQTVIAGNTRYVDVKLLGRAGTAQPAPVKQGSVKKGPGATTAAPAATAIKLRGFDFGTSEEDVRKHCSRVGKVVSVELKGDKGGSAVVTFSSMAAAEKAVQQLQQTVIAGNTRYVDVKLHRGADTAQPSKKRKADAESEAAPACKVLVRGFDKGTDLEAIVAHCSSAGEVVEYKMTKPGAILTYTSPDEAQAAVDSLDKSIIEGNARYIDVMIDQGKPRGEDGPSKRAKVGEKKEKGPSGPDLAREVVSSDHVTGKVVRFIRNSGFIKPHEKIDHPEAGRHKGDIYFHLQDVAGGEPLEKGTEVQFTVYVDASGLGAEDVTQI